MEQVDHNSSMEQQTNSKFYEERREFLKKSMYVAYATPVIMTMLVDKANATQSWCPDKGHEGRGHEGGGHENWGHEGGGHEGGGHDGGGHRGR